MKRHYFIPRDTIRRSCLVTMALAVFGSGCTTAPKTNFARVTGAASPPPVDGCVLESGDEIDVKFYYTPELNELAQPIRPDGKVSLQLVGEVQAAGQTPGSLEKALKDKYHGLIDKDEISVIARKFSHRVVYVGGAVHRPQAVPMAGQLTVLAAIMSAGGEDVQTAALGEVIVLRMEGGKYRGYAVDVSQTLAGNDLEPFFLSAGDTVYVSRTRISDVDRWIEQHINQVWPKIGITTLHNAGNNTVGVDMAR